jgi:DNA-directed RNA polymerase subunit M/transcription elongation factor TFIIS
MEFCKNCDFILFFSVTDDTLQPYCRHCGHVEECKRKLVIGLHKSFKPKCRVINELTKYDPTLLRSSNIPCPNKTCKSNEAAATEVIHIRYDEENMKYLYLCFHCDAIWETEE